MKPLLYMVLAISISACSNNMEANMYGSDGILVMDNYDRSMQTPDKPFTIPMRVLDNDLGYARIRSTSVFRAGNDANLLGQIKCGAEFMACVPPNWEGSANPYYYNLLVVDSHGAQILGFISKKVVERVED